MGRTRTANVVGGFVLIGVVLLDLTLGCNFCSPGECQGAILCEAYSTSGCPVDLGCTVKPACTCDLPDNGQHAAFCDPKVGCFDVGDASNKCGEIDGCVFKTVCQGTVLCSSFKDENGCKSHSNCSWSKDCG